MVGVGGILGGMVLEKGELRNLYQVSAAIIVLGGTLGAVMVTTPMGTFAPRRQALHAGLFGQVAIRLPATIEEIIEYATQARKQGIVSLEQAADNVSDPFLEEGLEPGGGRH